MARLASQAVKGFFATPPHLIPTITKYIRLQDTGDPAFRLLDPCCGEGEALDLLGQTFGLPTSCLYGNELDEPRACAAKVKGLNVLCGDSISELDTQNGGFSFLWENPPYDFEGDGQGRTEWKFFRNHLRLVRQQGIVVFVVPESILSRPEIAKDLPMKLKDIRIFRFPPEEYKAFRQVFLIGRKAGGKSVREERSFRAQLTSPLTWGDDCDVEYVLPAVHPGKVRFLTLHLTESQVLDMAASDPVTAILNAPFKVRDRRIRTLMQLRAGHQAMLLAGGAIDGVFTDPSTGNLLVVSGRVETRTVVKDSLDEDVDRVEVETPSPKVLAFDLDASLAEDAIVLYEFK